MKLIIVFYICVYLCLFVLLNVADYQKHKGPTKYYSFAKVLNKWPKLLFVIGFCFILVGILLEII